MPETYILDKCDFNRISEGKIRPSDISMEDRFVATHVQLDELRATAASSRVPELNRRTPYFLFPAFSFAHLFRCAAAIFLRADADMVRLAGAEAGVFAAFGCDPLRAFDHLAFCASAILRREAADTTRVGCPALRDLRGTPDPFNDSITEIA
jgi:hypothetical protein